MLYLATKNAGIVELWRPSAGGAKEVSPSMRKSAVSSSFWEHESHGCHSGAGFSLQRVFAFGVAFAFADQGSPSSYRAMELSGSTSHLFDPQKCRTMILLFKLPDLFREAERPINRAEDQLHPTGLSERLCMRTGLLHLPVVESQLPHPP